MYIYAEYWNDLLPREVGSLNRTETLRVGDRAEVVTVRNMQWKT